MIKLISLLNEDTQVDEKYMRTAYLFFIKYLGLPSDRMKLLFDMLGIDPISKQPLQANVVVKKGTPFKYGITVRTNSLMSKDEQIRHLAHEMFHVKQIESGRLDIQNHSWDGKIYPVPTNDYEYKILPWEIDARSHVMELSLAFNRYMREKGSVKRTVKLPTKN